MNAGLEVTRCDLKFPNGRYGQGGLDRIGWDGMGPDRIGEAGTEGLGQARLAEDRIGSAGTERMGKETTGLEWQVWIGLARAGGNRTGRPGMESGPVAWFGKERMGR